MAIHKFWKSMYFLNFKTSLEIPHPPPLQTSLWRIAHENQYVTHPLMVIALFCC